MEPAATAVLVGNWCAIELRGVLGNGCEAMAFLWSGTTVLFGLRSRYDTRPMSTVPSSA